MDIKSTNFQKYGILFFGICGALIFGTFGLGLITIFGLDAGASGVGTLQIVFTICGILLIALGVGIVVLLRRMSSPLSGIMSIVEHIKAKDFSIRSSFTADEEIGEIGNMLNTMVAELDVVFINVKQILQSIENMNVDLVSAVSETGVATREMIATIESVNKSLDRQKGAIEETVNEVNKMNEATEKIKQNIESQSSAVEQSSASIEQMVSSINSVSKSAENAKEIGQALEQIASQGETHIKTMMQSMQDISETSKKIAEGIGGITRLAATTNLLSMNAAIEAAHAGEAGKGFAVVAEEIRKLASDSGQEAKTIKKNVQETLEKIEHGAKLSEETGKAFGQILEDIDKTVKIIVEIANAMSEQRAGAQEILTSITHLVELSGLIKEGTSEEAEGALKVLDIIKRVDNEAQEIIQAAHEQLSGSYEIQKALDLLQVVSEKNKQLVDELRKKVSEVKVSSKLSEDQSRPESTPETIVSQE
jgi:methyl-accepting chemotaxis protein